MSSEKVIVIVGPTASGKTGVAIEIARDLQGLLSGRTAALDSAVRSHRTCSTAPLRSSNLPCATSQLASPQSGNFATSSPQSGNLATSSPQRSSRGAEIISADSRAIYRGMEIGTAAPTLEEQAGIPHWGIGIIEPGERFTVADWKKYAEEKIAEIRSRGNVPMVVGGTGLYIDSLVYNYGFTEQKKLDQSDRAEICTNYLLVGIKWTPEELRERITLRVNKLFNDELYDETRRLASLYNWNTQAMKSNIYQFVWSYLQGEITLEKAKELAVYDDWHLAKRQLTWFERNKKINWLPLAEVKPYVLKCIQDEQRR